MPIAYDKTSQTITLHTDHTSYQMKIGPCGFLMHTYYGPRITGDMSYAIAWGDRGFSGNPYDAGTDRGISADVMPLEYPCEGSGDYRYTALGVRRADGPSGCDLRYKDHRIDSGIYTLDGLPCLHANEADPADDPSTLTVLLGDESTGLHVELLYGVFPHADTITRAARIVNSGKNPLILQNAASASVDFLGGEWDLIHFEGRHCGERTPERLHIRHEETRIGSRRGTSSHQNNPFVILADRRTDEDHGSCMGLSLLYSGSFCCSAAMDQFGTVRIAEGIQPERFDYRLEPGESFETPEAAMIFTDCGLTNLSHKMHNMINDHICRGPWAKRSRPVLINSWESMGMDFDREKLLRFAKKASGLGVEMMVLDDGWFGERNSDYAGLGDWVANEKKMGGSMKSFAEEIRSMGMKFGIWIEPEMVNEDSDLYRQHPDWALKIPGKKPVRGRYQLVLDFSRSEVVDAVFDQIAGLFDECRPDYVKMDMNRSLSDVCTAAAGEQSQGKILHKYVLGVYRFMEKLLARYPELLLEGCSGGGGRYDAGMLYYCPQIWCSDNTDAIDRLQIQYGTSFGYPQSTFGAHVSAVPNGCTGRTVPFFTRRVVSLAGGFGFELDLETLTKEEENEVVRQIDDYHTYSDLLMGGLYYRLTDLVANREEAAWMTVSEDKSRALVSIVSLNRRGGQPLRFLRLKGLDSRRMYEDTESGEVFCGAALMAQGIPLLSLEREYEARRIFLREV